MELTAKAEHVIECFQIMRKLNEEVLAYCTDDCINCPIKSMCDYDRVIDFTDDRLDSIELIADYIDYAYKIDGRE